jgi:hypothetical protein
MVFETIDLPLASPLRRQRDVPDRQMALDFCFVSLGPTIRQTHTTHTFLGFRDLIDRKIPLLNANLEILLSPLCSYSCRKRRRDE